MKCNEVQEGIVDGNLSATAQAHLVNCPKCQALARDAEVLTAGLKMLAADAPPEPSWGFAGRVLSRPDERPVRFFAPLEVIARRALFAAGALAMTFLMLAAFTVGGSLNRDPRGSLVLSRNATANTAEVMLAGGVDDYEELNVMSELVNGGDPR